MPIHYDIDSQNKLITMVFRGTINLQDLEEHKQSILNDPLYRPEYDLLTDLRDCHVDVPPKEREEFSKSIADHKTPDHGRQAILANIPIEVAHGMIYSNHPQNKNKTSVFATPQAAYAWLGKSPQEPLN